MTICSNCKPKHPCESHASKGINFEDMRKAMEYLTLGKPPAMDWKLVTSPYLLDGQRVYLKTVRQNGFYTQVPCQTMAEADIICLSPNDYKKLIEEIDNENKK